MGLYYRIVSLANSVIQTSGGNNAVPTADGPEGIRSKKHLNLYVLVPMVFPRVMILLNQYFHTVMEDSIQL